MAAQEEAMSESATKKQRRPSTLFDLHKRLKIYEISDGDSTVRVGIRALDFTQNMKALETVEAARKQARIQYESEDRKALLGEATAQLSKKQVVEQIIGIERMNADNYSDLAPEQEGMDPEEAEKKAIERWETERQATLEAMDLKVLQGMLVERQTRSLVQIAAAQRFIEESLVRMIVDPETLEPMLSLEEKSPNYIGALMPETRSKLIEFRNEFLAGTGDKDIRAVAESDAFLRSGESRNTPTDSPGGTTEIQETSQPPLSSSTSSASG